MENRAAKAALDCKGLLGDKLQTYLKVGTAKMLCCMNHSGIIKHLLCVLKKANIRARPSNFVLVLVPQKAAVEVGTQAAPR